MKIKHFKSRLTALNLYNLRKYCKKYEIDYYEIDSSINYEESWLFAGSNPQNMEHLRSIAKMLRSSKDMFEITRYEDLQAQWIVENPLEYYRACEMYGETKSNDVGPIDTSFPLFSLKTKAHVCFSLVSLVKQKPQESLG